MVSVEQANNTYSYIEQKVRRLTASASEASLPSATIQDYVNRFYSNDFPYAIKIDQQRSVYKFLTIPNVDRYPVDVNNMQGFRAPVYFEGIQGNLFKNRDQLFNLYPRYPTQFQQGAGLSGSITNVTQANPAQVTSPDHQLKTGSVITITDVVGMTELNGNEYTVTLVDSNNFTLNGTDSTGFTAYISGGNWTSNNTFSFTLFGNNQNPFPQPNFGILSTQLVIGGIDENGNPIRIIDDGGAVVDSFGIGSNTTTGQLLFLKQNSVGDNVYLDSLNTQQPAIPNLSPLGGQVNANSNPPPPPSSYQAYPPSPLTNQYCGTVNYVTTQINLLIPVPIQAGSVLNIWAATYQVGRPYNLLFWNNELTIRPVPDNVYLVEVEVFQTPSQFMSTTDHPVLNQWAQYIAYGAACEILRDRQDMEGVQNLQEGFMRQEGLVLERQAVEEIGQPNITLFNSTQQGFGVGVGNGYGAGAF
jgi:ubiquitin-activating enzyme E1-like protein